MADGATYKQVCEAFCRGKRRSNGLTRSTGRVLWYNEFKLLYRRGDDLYIHMPREGSVQVVQRVNHVLACLGLEARAAYHRGRPVFDDMRVASTHPVKVLAWRRDKARRTPVRCETCNERLPNRAHADLCPAEQPGTRDFEGALRLTLSALDIVSNYPMFKETSGTVPHPFSRGGIASLARKAARKALQGI